MSLSQAAVMTGGLLSVLSLGLVSHGWEGVWQVAGKSGRTRLADWSLDPFREKTTLGVFSGQLILWGAIYGCHQTQVQRYCSVSTVARARIAVLFNILFFWIILGGSTVAGLVMFAELENCDTLGSRNIEDRDNLVAYYVLKVP